MTSDTEGRRSSPAGALADGSPLASDANPRGTALGERDYCESCGYTDSHDPNCPREPDDLVGKC